MCIISFELFVYWINCLHNILNPLSTIKTSVLTLATIIKYTNLFINNTMNLVISFKQLVY